MYTSILPNLLVPHIGEEVIRSKAKKVYICNVMTQPGETLSYSAADHVQALNDHMDRPFIDTIFVNNKEIPEEIKAKYAEEQARPVQFDTDVLKAMGLEVIPGEIITYDQHVIRHDTLESSRGRLSICCIRKNRNGGGKDVICIRNKKRAD